MTSAREIFENDMMNILKFTLNIHMMRVSTENANTKAPEIEDDIFWDKWFPSNCVISLSPPSLRNNKEMTVIFAFRETGPPILSTPNRIYNFIQDDNCYWYQQSITPDENMCNYLFYAYHQFYKNKIREWALEEYLFCPK